MGDGRLRGVDEIGTSKVREPHQIPSVVIPVSRHNTRRRRHLHLLQQPREHVFRHVAVVNEAHVFALFALFQAPLHAVHHRTRHVVVHVQIGVARRLQGIGLHARGLKESEDFGQGMPDDVLQKHDALRASSLGQGQEPIQVPRDVDDRQLLLVLFESQPHREVAVSVDQLGHFDLAAQHDRHQFRSHGEPEIRRHKFSVSLFQLVLAHKANVLALQRGNHFVKGLVVLPTQAFDPRDDLGQRFVVGEAEGGLGFFVHHQDPLQVGHANAVEFVEVVGEDAQEPHPLNQRRAGNLRLLQHALVEGQPAQLAVDEVPFCRGFSHGTKMDLNAATLGRKDVEQMLPFLEAQKRTPPRRACYL